MTEKRNENKKKERNERQEELKEKAESLKEQITGRVKEEVGALAGDENLVRGRPDAVEDMVEGARHAFLGRLPEERESLEPSRYPTLMCGSGVRATIEASLLRRAGFEHVDVFLGSMGAWKGAGRPTVKPTS